MAHFFIRNWSLHVANCEESHYVILTYSEYIRTGNTYREYLRTGNTYAQGIHTRREYIRTGNTYVQGIHTYREYIRTGNTYVQGIHVHTYREYTLRTARVLRGAYRFTLILFAFDRTAATIRLFIFFCFVLFWIHATRFGFLRQVCMHSIYSCQENEIFKYFHSPSCCKICFDKPDSGLLSKLLPNR